MRACMCVVCVIEESCFSLVLRIGNIIMASQTGIALLVVGAKHKE